MDKQNNRCPICGEENNCAAVEGIDIDNCWCKNMPPLSRDILKRYEGRPCFCRSCYEKLLKEEND